jgi:hypothetical protein
VNAHSGSFQELTAIELNRKTYSGEIKMPRSTTQRRKGRGEVIPPLTALQRVSALLKEHLAIFTTKTDLTDEEVEHWHHDLSPYRLEAIEYAFDNWRRNGRFFPVYADIIELCEAWEPAVRKQEKCSEDCRSRHGRGYGWPDIMALWKLYNAKFAALGRKLTHAEWESLYDEIDRLRGQSPAWR